MNLGKSLNPSACFLICKTKVVPTPGACGEISVRFAKCLSGSYVYQLPCPEPGESSVPMALLSLTEFRGCVPCVPDTRNGMIFCLTSQTCCPVRDFALALALSGMLQQTPLLTGWHPFKLSSDCQNSRVWGACKRPAQSMQPSKRLHSSCGTVFRADVSGPLWTWVMVKRLFSALDEAWWGWRRFVSFPFLHSCSQECGTEQPSGWAEGESRMPRWQRKDQNEFGSAHGHVEPSVRKRTIFLSKTFYLVYILI